MRCLKVLIVDDENLICEWLEFCISQNPACQLAGVAHNGSEALDLFRQTGADLVLTDIKMPVMDGLELLHTIRGLSDTVKVVLLTAFAEFDMARRALREGADEYLLKNEMNNEALQELLARMAKVCDVDDTGGMMVSAQAHAIVRKILLQEPPLSDEDLVTLRTCGVRWRSNGLFALAVWKQSLMSNGLQLPVGDPGHHITGFDYTDRIYVVIGNLPRALSSSEKSRQLTNYAKQVQQTNRCMVGVSSVTDEMRQIPAMAKQAAFSLAQSFYVGQVKLYEPQRPLAELEARDKAWLSKLSTLRMRMYQQRADERYETLAAFLRDTAEREIGAVDVVTKFCLDSFDFLYLDAREQSASPATPKEMRAKLATSTSMAETSELLLDFARQCTPREKLHRHCSKAVSLAQEYIRASYAQPLSLEQVAAEVHLNPEYFSRVFKEETGMTFVNFLTDVRLGHSVQMLENTALRVQDVAQAVGYANVSYFSTTFKKKYGMSPYEYRRRSE